MASTYERKMSSKNDGDNESDSEEIEIHVPNFLLERPNRRPETSSSTSSTMRNDHDDEGDEIMLFVPNSLLERPDKSTRIASSTPGIEDELHSPENSSFWNEAAYISIGESANEKVASKQSDEKETKKSSDDGGGRVSPRGTLLAMKVRKLETEVVSTLQATCMPQESESVGSFFGSKNTSSTQKSQAHDETSRAPKESVTDKSASNCPEGAADRNSGLRCLLKIFQCICTSLCFSEGEEEVALSMTEHCRPTQTLGPPPSTSPADRLEQALSTPVKGSITSRSSVDPAQPSVGKVHLSNENRNIENTLNNQSCDEVPANGSRPQLMHPARSPFCDETGFRNEGYTGKYAITIL